MTDEQRIKKLEDGVDRLKVNLQAITVLFILMCLGIICMGIGAILA